MSLVVLNHLWPKRLTGGYVGVDVFFVISGFLISSQLIREITTTGRIRLARFYARRVRRLLPAAFLVLAFIVVAAYFLLPYPRWETNAQEVVASGLYWENWLLAAKSVDYSQLTQSASLTQHYWSLSVEEQFYLFWPLLLVLLFKIRVRHARFAGIVIVGLASLAFSIYFTRVDKSQAYFVTPVRVWEFAIGALIALGGARFTLPRLAANLASLAGFAGIVAAAVLFNTQTAFPGATALLPAVGTGLVIAAGTRPGRQWHTAVSSSRPVQWLGNISYSLYLWHWPLIMLAPFAFPGMLVAGALTYPLKLAILAVSLIVADASKRFVEDPIRTWPRLSGRVGVTFAGMVAGMLTICVLAGGLVWTYQRHVGQAVAVAAQQERIQQSILRTQPDDSCYGAAAMVPGRNCADPFGPATTVVMGPANEYWDPGGLPSSACVQVTQYAPGASARCDFSSGTGKPTVVWLIGDSHAQQWQAPLVNIARRNHWVLNVAFLGGCPFADVAAVGYDGNAIPGGNVQCENWTKTMVGVVAASHPTYVFTSFFARDEPVNDHSGRTQAQQYQTGLSEYWSQWTSVGATVYVISDPPLNGDVRAADCVVLNPSNPLACAVARNVAQPPDPLSLAAQSSTDPKVKLIDLTSYFCDQQRCYAVIGKVAVYYDTTHLNLAYSLSLENMIAGAVGVPD